MGTIYHVAILVLQLKPQYTYWKLDFRHESWQGASSSPRSRHSSKCLWTAHSNPWILQGRSSLTFEDWQFLNTRFPVLTDLYPRRLVSNKHTGEKYINVRAGKSLTPPKLERNVVHSLGLYPVFDSYRGVRLANSRYTQSYATQAVL